MPPNTEEGGEGGARTNETKGGVKQEIGCKLHARTWGEQHAAPTGFAR